MIIYLTHDEECVEDFDIKFLPSSSLNLDKLMSYALKDKLTLNEITFIQASYIEDLEHAKKCHYFDDMNDSIVFSRKPDTKFLQIFHKTYVDFLHNMGYRTRHIDNYQTKLPV